MADATVAMEVNAFPNGIDNTQKRYIVYGVATITANAGTGPATGLPLTWTSMTDGNLNGASPFILQVGPTQTKPAFAEFQSSGDNVQTYTYNSANDALVVRGTTGVLTTGIVADTINFKAEFIRGTY